MNIDKINGIIGNYSSKQSSIKPNTSISKDEVKISKSALDKLQWEKTFNIVKNSPDIRTKEVAEAKQNLEKHFENGQLKQEIADKMADKIIDNLFT